MSGSAAGPGAGRELLVSGARQLGLSLTPVQANALLVYLQLLQKWNQVYNLTAVRDPADMLTHHLLDSLAVIGPLRNRLAAPVYDMDGADEAQAPVEPQFRLLDVGSGAGLPGVVIAICCPDIAVDCVDTVAKKVAFINQAAGALRLPNLRGLHSRVEKLGNQAGDKAGDTYHVISARAFSSLPDLVKGSAAALEDQGVWLAMKGKHPADELAALPADIEVFHVEQLKVPGRDAERCIVWMRERGSI